MKRNIDNVDGLDDKGQQAKRKNQQPGSDTASFSRDKGQHAENAQVSQTALATSFAQQESVLTAEQIESLKGFDKEGVGIVLDKIALDAREGYPEALNTISRILVSFDKTELISIFQRSPHTLDNIAYIAYEGEPAALNAISAELAKFSKDELYDIFQKLPDILNDIATAANVQFDDWKPQPDALNAISEALKYFSKEELRGIFQLKPPALSSIAGAASRGNPLALNAISPELAKFSKEELKGIFQDESAPLEDIAGAAAKGHPKALNAVSGQLAKFDKDELEGILQVGPSALSSIAGAASRGNPLALNAISPELAKFSKEELKGIFQDESAPLEDIAGAAAKGHPKALNAVSGQLAKFDKDELEGILQVGPSALSRIAHAAHWFNPSALNAISAELANLSKDDLKEIFQKSEDTLHHIALAAGKGHPDALNAISTKLRSFTKKELKAIFQNSPHTLKHIALAAIVGHPDALNALLTPLDGVTGLGSHGGSEYLTYLNGFMQSHLSSLKSKSRFLSLERAFCNLGETAFSRITNGVAPEIISPLKKSITWYKEFTVIFNGDSSDQSYVSSTEFQVQENLSARLRRFINDNVLQQYQDQSDRLCRIDFVKGLCDYLTMVGYHHLVLDLNKIYLTYQSGLNGYNTSGYADSILYEFSSSLAPPSEISFFAASQESNLDRDQRYKKAYDMLKSFNQNLGLWIQFKPGRDPLSAQDTVVGHFKVLLRSYLNVLNDGMDDTMDYEQVNEALTENSWSGFKSIIKDFMIEAAVDEADSALMPSGFRP